MWVERVSLDNERLSAGFGGNQKPDLIFLFGGAQALREGPVIGDLAKRFPDAIQIGCTTGTVVDNDGAYEDALTATMVGFSRTRLRLVTRRVSTETSGAMGREIGQDLAAPDLAGIYVLADGLDVNGSALVEGLVAGAGPEAAISGGLAADGGRFADTKIVAQGRMLENSVAAVGFYGDAIRIANGAVGGWDEFGPYRKITRAQGNVLYELDGKPALGLYERYLGEEAGSLPASGLLYPLKVRNPADPASEVVRTLLGIDRTTGSATFAGDVPQGWSARLMRGSVDRLTERAGDAGLRALSAMPDLRPQLCLMTSCVGRTLLMGQRTEDEVLSLSAALGGDVPITGFYSNGEIGPHALSGACCLHNQTLTITLLAEAA